MSKRIITCHCILHDKNSESALHAHLSTIHNYDELVFLYNFLILIKKNLHVDVLLYNFKTKMLLPQNTNVPKKPYNVYLPEYHQTVMSQ